jgi:prevent-host-death family protein
MYKSSCTLCTVTRRISISEARRLLPQLVREVVADGGRVDITYRGKPQVSLLRVLDVKGSGAATPRKLRDALKVELADGPEALLAAIREVRRANVPRVESFAKAPQLRGRSKTRTKKHR